MGGGEVETEREIHRGRGAEWGWVGEEMGKERGKALRWGVRNKGKEERD